MVATMALEEGVSRGTALRLVEPFPAGFAYVEARERRTLSSLHRPIP